MKQLLLNLKFYCRNCKQDVPYGKFNQHSSGGRCKPVVGAVTHEQEVVMFNPNQQANVDLVDALYIFERDTKFVHRFDLQNNRLVKQTVAMGFNFPHNFQAVYSPSKQLFLIGGGDFSQNQENLYKTTEIDVNTW